MRFEVGKVYLMGDTRYKVLYTKGDAMGIKIISDSYGFWRNGEETVFSQTVAQGDVLDKEYTVKELLRNVEKQEKADSKRSAKGNAGDSKPKTKKGCKKCDSNGCRCNASGR